MDAIRTLATALTALAAALLLLSSGSIVGAEELVDGRRSVVLEGRKARIVVDILGGSIVEFRLRNNELNPLRWNNDGPTDEARSLSHFLCLDRWGRATEAEEANGMYFHGEATRVEWKVPEEAQSKARMTADLPMAGLSVDRTIEVASEGAWFRVSETVTNRNKLGRTYNMVQHPTIGPPFLDESVIVDSNAARGFMQSSPMPNPEEPSVVWPQALKDGWQPVNMRRLAEDPNPNVVSYVVHDEIGWVTAVNAARGLLIGYLWRTDEYPWLNMWRNVRNGKPLARGLEFGTTGLHAPFPALVEKGRIFGKPLLDYLDAGESKTRSYLGFLAEVPPDFAGVVSIDLSEREVRIQERGSSRDVRLAVPGTVLGAASA